MGWYLWDEYRLQQSLVAEVQSGKETAAKLDQTAQALAELQGEDQVVKNASSSAEIKNIETTYEEGSDLFTARADLVAQGVKTADLDKMIAKFLALLSDEKWQEAKDQNALIKTKIDAMNVASASQVATTKGVTASNTLPSSGFSRQKVSTSRGDFVVVMEVAPGARVIVAIIAR